MLVNTHYVYLIENRRQIAVPDDVYRNKRVEHSTNLHNHLQSARTQCMDVIRFFSSFVTFDAVQVF